MAGQLDTLVRERMFAKNIMSLRELGRLADISAPQLSRLLGGVVPLTKKSALKIAAVLECEADELLVAARSSRPQPMYTAEQLKFLGEVSATLTPFIKQPFSQDLLNLLLRDRFDDDD